MRFLAPLLALVFLLPPGLAAQGGTGVVEGTVATATGATLGSVRVAVLSAADSSVAGAQTTSINGRFRITGLRPGRYRVAASLVGFNPYTGPVVTITAASPTVNAG